MSYFIIIRGPLGAGKTEVSQKLANLLNAYYVPIDRVLEKHGLDKADPDAEGIPTEHFIKANELVLPEVKQRLASGTPVIFDGSFYRQAAIEYLKRELSYPCYAFTLKAPVEVCIERDRKRPKPYGEDAATAVHLMVSRFDYGTIIDATQQLENVVQAIRTSLGKK